MLLPPDNPLNRMRRSIERGLEPVPIGVSQDWRRQPTALKQQWVRLRLASGFGLLLALAVVLLMMQSCYGQNKPRPVEGQRDPYWKPNRFVQTSARRVARSPGDQTSLRSESDQVFQDGQPAIQAPSEGRILVDPQDVLQGLNLSRPSANGPFRSREFQEQGVPFIPGGPQNSAQPLEPVPFSLNRIPIDQLKPDADEAEPADELSLPEREELPPAMSSAPTPDRQRANSRDAGQPEVITENYPNGKPRVIRTVKMDKDGNYYNDGPWKVLNQSGDVVAQGSYRLGVMDGVWGRRHLASEGGLFATKPFTFYTGPFDSFANFKDGKLHGHWVIYNQNGVGQKVFEIEYRDGKRHGQATWYYPNQQTFRQASFKQGVLDGEVLEWDNSPDHRLVKRERYFDGRQLIQTTASYSTEAKQSVVTYLNQKLVPEGQDNWWEAKPTPFLPQGQRVQEGPVASWYSNQQLKHRGQYKADHPVGTFYWWHENGNRKSRGSFDDNGQRHGTWIWWHASGMKQFEGQYSHGEPKGLWRSWLEDGQLRKEKNYDDPVMMGPEPVEGDFADRGGPETDAENARSQSPGEREEIGGIPQGIPESQNQDTAPLPVPEKQPDPDSSNDSAETESDDIPFQIEPLTETSDQG